jgi:1-acyl-sn-glycerol-3-phosphate acyltransferase
MDVVRSLAFALIFYPATALASLFAFPVALLGTRALRGYVRGWARFHRLCAALILGVRTRVEGAVPHDPALIAAKHQSMFETIEMVLLLGEPAVVMKRQLADIPLWGWVARRYGVIPIDRAGGAAALRRMIRAAEAAIAEGRPIVIFPEGTRVAPGGRPPLQPGFAGLYRRLGLPVVPIALDSGRLWPRHSFVKRAGIVTFRVGEAIPPGLDRPAIERVVHREINILEDRADV